MDGTLAKIGGSEFRGNALVVPHNMVVRVFVEEFVVLAAEISIIVDAETLSFFFTGLQAALFWSKAKVCLFFESKPGLHHME